jgi:hypothetical protein
MFVIDDILRMILQFGDFDDFITCGQICKQFNKCRSIDHVAIQLNDHKLDDNSLSRVTNSQMCDNYHNWLKSKKWKQAIMKGYHLEALDFVRDSVLVLHIYDWDQPRITYDCIFPERLVELSIISSYFDDFLSLEHLSNLAKLSVTKSGNVEIISFPLQLEYIDLSNTDCSDVSQLRRLTTLHTLNLSNCEELVTLDDLEHLTNLRDFSMGGKNEIAGFQLEFFLSCMQNLTSLNFSESGLLSNSHLSLISKYPNLHSLNISHTQKPLELSIISKMPNLQELNIDGLEYITDNDIRVISYLPNLTKLHMSGSSQVTSVSVLNKIKTFQYLDISKCNVTDYTTLPKHVKIWRYVWVPLGIYGSR